MMQLRAELDIPYPQQDVFDLVADIESYSEFLPHVVFARIRRREGNALWVDQVIRLGILRLPFSTRALLSSPSHIHIVCDESSFGHFVEDWHFEPNHDGGTRLRSITAYELRSAMVGRILSAQLGALQKATLRAFAQRATRMYRGADARPEISGTEMRGERRLPR